MCAAVLVVWMQPSSTPATDGGHAPEVGPLPDDPNLVPPGRMPTYFNILKVDKPITDRAYAVWKRHCPGLTKALPYITEIKVIDQGIVLAREAEARAWPIALVISVDFAEDDLSAAWQRRQYVHTASFLLGSGREPGIIPIGDGNRLCLGKNVDFIKVPELTFLKRWPSDDLP